MPKMKTHKATQKRVKISKGKKKKMMTKTCGQAHFNSRESGNTTRSKRKRSEVSTTDEKNFKQLLPYHA